MGIAILGQILILFFVCPGAFDGLMWGLEKILVLCVSKMINDNVYYIFYEKNNITGFATGPWP